MCGKKIDRWIYKNAIYCNDNCRKRSYDLRKGRTKLKTGKKGFQDVVDIEEG